MYELVNTSLPNGLLPGTHGFATVAMTRGTPDQVRLALESLSSYKHRHGGHDERYKTENPVAWSHLVLRDGAHVISCVRASDFDYTGRTNRLARHWCFPRGEFPSGSNPADMAASNVEALFSSWKGNAQWLEPRPPPASRGRADLRSAAWISLYGHERGAVLAAGFAALLRSEAQGANRPIVFRTSQSWDVNGTKLLQLFGDLIALLPPDLRGRVSFSTYPDALPDYFVCNLRGVQQDDTKKESVSAGRPWLDCMTGAVGNEAKLPRDPELEFLAVHGRPRPEFRDDVAVAPVAAEPETKAENRASPDRDVSSPQVAPAVPPQRQKTTAGQSVQNDWLPPPKRDDTMLYAVCGGLFFAAAIVAAFFVLHIKPKTTDHDQQPPETNSVAGPFEVRPEEVVAASATNVPPSVADSEIAEAPVPDDDRPEAEKSASATPPPEVSSQLSSGTPPVEPKFAFEEATELIDSEPTAGKSFGKATWFFYGDKDVLYEVDGTPEQRGGLFWSFKNKPKSESNVWKRCVLFYCHENKALYMRFPDEKIRLFEKDDKVDLKRMCFGPCQAVYESWRRLNNVEPTYEILCFDGKSSAGVFTNKNDALDFDMAFREIHNVALGKLENGLRAAKERHDLGKDELRKAESWLDAASNVVDRVKAINGEKDEAKKKKKKDSLGNYIKEKFSDKPNLPDPVVTGWKGVVEQLEENVKKAKREDGNNENNLKKANEELDSYTKNESNRKTVKDMSFSAKPIAAKGQYR